jgi:hypothetical protein
MYLAALVNAQFSFSHVYELATRERTIAAAARPGF